MCHRVKRLCCIPVLALVSALLTGVEAQAQLIQKPNEARVMLLNGNGDPIPAGLMTISGSNGTVLTPSDEEDGAYRFTNVGRKLILEFANRGPKNVPIEVVLIDAPSVFVSIRVDPATGVVKEILQKPQFLAPSPRGKVRSHPPGGQQALVPPANDACAMPTPIFNGATPFTTVDATTDGIPPGCSGTANIHKDIWFDYMATDRKSTRLNSSHSQI